MSRLRVSTGLEGMAEEAHQSMLEELAVTIRNWDNENADISEGSTVSHVLLAIRFYGISQL